MNVANVKIGIRLGVGFGLILTMFVIMAITNLSSMSKIQTNFDANVKTTNVKIDALTQWRQVMMESIIIGRNLLFLTEIQALQVENKRFAVANAENTRLLDKLTQLVTPEEKRLLDKIAAARVPEIEAQKKVAALSQGFEQDAAMQMMIKEVHPLQQKVLIAISDLINFMQQKAAADNEEAAKTLASARLLTFLATGMALLLGGLIAWAVERSIVDPINAAVEIARRVAEGDLTAKIEVTSLDEMGALMGALRHMNESLVKIVGEVRAGTDTIASASAKIAADNQDLSSRTEEEAGSLDKTALAMDQLATTVKQNADNARQANQMAMSASEVALKGGAIVAQVVDTMGSINESSRKIADIIGVIDGIAFQTNILALNAAVEAARAGEQGRGFAVVASEVRGLAQRSAAAAKEIKTLIGDSVDKVKGGGILVDQAGTTMNEIVASVKRVTDIMAEITAASQEQTVGIDQINRAMNQMDLATQQNAKLVEEEAVAAESLQDQARNLSHVVSVFKLADAPARPPPASAARAAIAPNARTSRPVAISAAKPAVRASAAKTAKSVAQDDGWEEF